MSEGEAAAGAADERYRKVFEYSNDAIFLIDVAADRILDANSRASDMLGYSHDELLRLPVSKVHPDEMPALRRFIDGVAREGHGWTDELSCMTRGGDRIPAEISASTVTLGGRECALAIVRDIRQRKEAEDALRRSEKRYRAIYDFTPVMMHSIDQDGRLINVNRYWLETLGYERHEVIGQRGPDFLAEESKRDALQTIIPRLWREGHIEDVEYQMVKKSGEVIDVVISAVALENPETGAQFSVAFIVDVTERKRMESALRESEQRLGRVLASAMDAIVTFRDDSGEIRLFNQAAERTLRCREQDAIGTDFDRFLTPRLRELLTEARRAFDRGDRHFLWIPEGATARRADGEEFPIEATISRVEAAGELLCTVILRDVNERRAAEAALERLQREKDYLREELESIHDFGEIVGESPAIRQILQQIETVAPTGATALIQGETGTGKELVARAIHRLSPLADKPLVSVNCAALPSTLIESELFGHEKGAFTGALARKLGRFELADGGTIFLDEIGDLPLELQAKMLRVLQDGEYERVGGSTTLHAEVRVIAATNRDLEEAIAAGHFRTDLFYRLNVFPIVVPPLRERTEDIPLLARHFVMTTAVKLGKSVSHVPRATLSALSAYSWPGNVRELQNVVERGVIVTDGDTLEPGPWLPTPARSAAAAADRHLELDEVLRRHIVTTLEATGWRVSGDRGAARILGLKPTTLEARMKKLGIRRPGSPPTRPDR